MGSQSQRFGLFWSKSWIEVGFTSALSDQVCTQASVTRLAQHQSVRAFSLRDHVFTNLHSQNRQLIELRMEHADLDALIDRIADEVPLDELMVRRLKKRRLALRDDIARLERELTPNEPA